MRTKMKFFLTVVLTLAISVGAFGQEGKIEGETKEVKHEEKYITAQQFIELQELQIKILREDKKERQISKQKNRRLKMAVSISLFVVGMIVVVTSHN